MRTQVVAFFLSLGVSALMTPIVLRLSRRFNLFDEPDGDRKIHTGKIPRLGGIGIALGLLAPLLGLLFHTNDYAIVLRGDELRLSAFFVGLFAIVGLGLYDDLHGAGAILKLTVQCMVGALLWYAGVTIKRMVLFDQVIEFGIWSLPLTMLWVAGLINAMNLIDGLDGLAGGVAFFAAISLFVIAWFDGNIILGLFGAAIAGSVMGFLLYNFAPAMIFMGDAGSMTIGYVFAVAALWSAAKRSTVMALMLPVIALGVPILDTLFAFTRRAATGRSPFRSDRGHIHHRLLDAGLSHRQAVLAIYAVCCVLTGAAVVMRATEDPVSGLMLLGLAVALAVTARAMFRLARAVRSREQAPAAEPESAAESAEAEPAAVESAPEPQSTSEEEKAATLRVG